MVTGLPIPELDDVLRDPATSDWLKRAIVGLIARDPIDAERDARELHYLMALRAALVLS